MTMSASAGLSSPQMALAAGFCAAYLFIFYRDLATRPGQPTAADMTLSVLGVLLLIEATRRVVGPPMAIIASLMLVFAFAGPYMPDAVAHKGVSLHKAVTHFWLSTEGVFGVALGVSSSYIFLFVLFGGLLEKAGAGSYFIKVAYALLGHLRGGPAKAAVVSSGLMGMISGSSVANVVTCGTFTIPLMKRVGYPAHKAGALETAAGVDGQIMPPVMGAAAFVMAEFLAVPYATVALWAVIPAILYYLAVFFAVHFEAKRYGLHGVPKNELPVLGHVMLERGHLFIPIITIFIGLTMGYSAPLCALAGALMCLPIALMRKATREGISWRNVLDALEEGAKNTLAVAMACACAGIVIGCVTITGLGIVFTQVVVGLAQNMLPLALILTAIAGIVLGMGMPTTPAYIVMVSLLVPALVKLGAPLPSAHMFAFYFAILSAITPPVALAVFAAASLAKADLWESGWAAVRIGAAGFIVPFMFVFEPSLLMIGAWHDILHSFITATIGTICLAGGLFGYFYRIAHAWERVLLLCAALLLIKPGILTDIAGLVLLAVVLINQMYVRRHEPKNDARPQPAQT